MGGIVIIVRTVLDGRKFGPSRISLQPGIRIGVRIGIRIGIGVRTGIAFLAGVERSRSTPDTSGRQLGKGVENIGRPGPETAHPGRQAAAIDRDVLVIDEFAERSAGQLRAGESRAELLQHPVAEAREAGQLDGRAVGRSGGRQEPVVPVIRLFIPAGEEGHGKGRKQKRKNLFHQRCVYSLCFESIQIVTGPSLSSSTCMSAPNWPVATSRPSSSATRAAKRS